MVVVDSAVVDPPPEHAATNAARAMTTARTPIRRTGPDPTVGPEPPTVARRLEQMGEDAAAPGPTGERPSYAAPRHLMHLLHIVTTQDADGEVRGEFAVRPQLLDARGGPRLAVVAMLIDALGGLRSITASVPDWAFTADMSIHLTEAGPVRSLRADLHVRRRGRRTLVIEVDLVADGIRSAGSAILTFAVVPRPSHLTDLVVAIEPGTRPMGSTDEVLELDWIDEIGADHPAPGTVVLTSRREVQNTVGAVHGAIHAALADDAAVTLGTRLLGAPCAATDLHLAYLDLATDGPFTATATAVGGPSSDSASLAATVEIVDAAGRLCSYSTVRVRRVDADGAH